MTGSNVEKLTRKALFECGEITEVGTQDELMNNGEKYAELFAIRSSP